MLHRYVVIWLAAIVKRYLDNIDLARLALLDLVGFLGVTC